MTSEANQGLFSEAGGRLDEEACGPSVLGLGVLSSEA